MTGKARRLRNSIARLLELEDAEDLAKATVEAVCLLHRADLVVVRLPQREQWIGNALRQEIDTILEGYEGAGRPLRELLEGPDQTDASFDLRPRRALRFRFPSLENLAFVTLVRAPDGALTAALFQRPPAAKDLQDLLGDLKIAVGHLSHLKSQAEMLAEGSLPLLPPLEIDDTVPRRFLEAVLRTLKHYLVQVSGVPEDSLWFLERKGGETSSSLQFGYFFTRDDLRKVAEVFGEAKTVTQILLSPESFYSLDRGTGLSPYVGSVGCLHVAQNWRRDPRVDSEEYPQTLRDWEERALPFKHLFQVPSRRQEVPYILMYGYNDELLDPGRAVQLASAFRHCAPLFRLAAEGEKIHTLLVAEESRARALADVSSLTSFLVHNASKAFINPLVLIRWDMASLVEGLEEPQKAFTVGILRRLDRVTTALQQTTTYLDLVRRPGEPRRLRVEEVDLCRALLEFALPTAAERIPELDEYLRTDLFSRCVQIEHDCDLKIPRKLRGSQVFTGQALLVLLQNAIEALNPSILKAEPTRGRISVSISETGSEESGFVVVEVRDRGKGMNSQQAYRLRQAITRATSSDPMEVSSRERLSSKGGEHLGIGLLCTAQYLGALGGSMALESEPNVGTAVRLYFPKTTPEEFEL